MKLKKIITLFCLLVLSIQLLPVKQLGLIFFNNQLQEEIPHAPFEKCSAEKDMFKSDLLLNGSYPLSALFTTEAKQYPHLIIALPAAHAAEILTPPPNFS
jgi:hypothetical protein